MTHPGRNVPETDVLNVDQDVIEARVRDRHVEELHGWGPRRWLAERRVRKEIGEEISRAETRASRRGDHKTRLF
jgi:hypothetical protein